MKKIHSVQFLLLFGVSILLTCCSPAIREGMITYTITTDGNFSQKNNATVLFNEEYVKILPIRHFFMSNNLTGNPGFHSFFLYKWTGGDILEYKNYLDKYYVVNQTEHISDSTLRFIPLKGKDKILGYPCKKALLTTESDTVTIWYTTKIKAQFTPFYFRNPNAFVVKLEKYDWIRDYGWVDRKLEEGEVFKDSTNRIRFLDGNELVEIPMKRMRTVVEAIKIQDSAIISRDLIPVPLDPIITRNEFYQIVKGISFEQFNPGDAFPPYASIKYLLDQQGQTLSTNIPQIVYYWETDHILLYDNWLALQDIRSKFDEKQVTIITLPKRKEQEQRPLDQWLTEFPLEAYHIEDATEHIENNNIRLLPVAVVIDTNGKVVESVYSGNQHFQERLMSALTRTLNTQ